MPNPPTHKTGPPMRVRPIRNPLPARIPPGAEYVGRAGWGLSASPYANPHPYDKHCPVCGGQVHTHGEAVALYREHLRRRPELVERARAELPGKDLACWCPLPGQGEADVCHAAVLIAVVAGEAP